ncbi:replication factor C subunit 2 isoform X1 [Histomonas meleagridis]|uniref:replication factor C subunit 2 isoform X1 n=1 Tax=Histomonas meleagridis TaxID=135588 RepID=UPI003559BF34|nr:replication factor C subunit 2 isoform X1 [Histomonas meleagridis]KAH0796812.1 replication factor C subunit 2 isoform X1 [Histomonas meleagridis]
MEENIPWVEKYRPHNIDEIVQQEEVVNALRSTLGKGDLPHLIFHGPPGSGKTSTAIALCHTLFEPKEFRRRVMELNASDDRGIDSVRSKIKQFASLSVPQGSVPYKIIILDEADSMTRDAQNALRRVIENYSAVTRFIIICNYVSKIIDPILSRCARFRFKSLERDNIINRLQFIAEQEHLKVESEEAFQTLVDISGGDLRKAITFLQSSSITGVISGNLIRELSGSPNPDVIHHYFDTCINSPWNEIEEATSHIVYSGFDISQILEILTRILVSSEAIKEEVKPELIMRISAADGMITNRADPYLQFLAISSAINAATH